MNKYYLSHAFKREYGVSPINYMITRRIEESKYLLAETDLSMSQIAQLLGFSSLSYFSQVFRKTQGISPMEYRHNAREL
jgi:AraC-like DNA-binding protein